MKKESIVLKEKVNCEVEILINNTALVSLGNQKGLVNIKTNSVVGSFKKFYTIYNEKDQFYFQEEKVKPTYIRIYDALYEKTLIEQFIKVDTIINGQHEFMILQNPNSQKYHIFDQKLVRTSENVLEEEFDLVEFLYSDFYGYFLRVTKNGKKAIYEYGKGFITEFEFDNIEKIDDIIIFTKGSEKYFTCNDTDENQKEIKVQSPIFDDINVQMHKKGATLVYCKKGNLTIVYKVSGYKHTHLFVFKDCEVVKCLSNDKYKYIFLIKKLDINCFEKYGLMLGNYDPKLPEGQECTNLTNFEYDVIEHYPKNEWHFLLYKNNKVGLLRSSPSTGDAFIEARHDKIRIFGDFYLLYTKENCDIVSKDNIYHPYVRNFKIIDDDNYETIIFEKNGKKGLFFGVSDEPIIYYDCDNINDLGYQFFEIEKGEYTGLIYNRKVLFQPIYKRIDISNDTKRLYHEILYFALKKDNNEYDLARLKKIKINRDKNELVILDNKRLKNVEFFKEIMVLEDERVASVYDYNEKLLKCFPAGIEIYEIKREYGKYYTYLIDGKYYFYKNNKFEEQYAVENDFYITTYESDYGIVVVKSHDKEKHDEMCANIEIDSDEVFDKKLISMYENNKEIQEKYPQLVRKK